MSIFKQIPIKILNYLYKIDALGKREYEKEKSITEVSRECKISYATTLKTLRRLEIYGYAQSRVIGNAKIYCITKKGKELFKRIIETGEKNIFNGGSSI